MSERTAIGLVLLLILTILCLAGVVGELIFSFGS